MRAHLAQSILHLLKVAILVKVVAQELGTKCLEHIGRAGQQDAAQQLHYEPVCLDDVLVTCAVHRGLEEACKESHEATHTHCPL